MTAFGKKEIKKCRTTSSVNVSLGRRPPPPLTLDVVRHLKTMRKRKDFIIAIGLLLPLTIYAIFCLTLMCIFFGYLNQGYPIETGSTDSVRELTFLNYLLPFILTVGFMFCFVVDRVKQFKTNISSWTGIILLSAFAVTAIFWQVEQIKWVIEKSSSDFNEWSPFIIGLAFTIGVVAPRVINFIKRKKNVAQHCA